MFNMVMALLVAFVLKAIVIAEKMEFMKFLALPLHVCLFANDFELILSFIDIELMYVLTFAGPNLVQDEYRTSH